MLENTSYAILPHDGEEGRQKNHSIKHIQSYEWDGTILKGTLSKGTFALYFVSEKMVRLIVNPFGKVNLNPSIAVIGDGGPVSCVMKENHQELELILGLTRIILQKDPLSIKILRNEKVFMETKDSFVSFTSSKKIALSIKNSQETPVYGLGEKTGFLNKNGSKISNWNTDVFSPHNKDTVELYQSIPFAIFHNIDKTLGLFFDNSFRTEFDMQTFNDQVVISADRGAINSYFLLGEDIKETVGIYTQLTGRTPLPPKWSLGYHQSRYSYKSESEVRKIVDLFNKYQIPLDCIYLDIHYMDGYRVFTHDFDQFPNFEEMLGDLQKQNIDVVPIVDPGVKKDVHYPVYQEGIKNDYFSKYLDGTIYHGEVWPGQSAFPDFFQTKVQRWWGGLHNFYTKMGIRGIWNDMNEPSVFNESKTMDLDVHHNLDGHLISHEEGHNLYGLYMSKSTFEGLQRLLNNTRPFSLTRAGYAGVQRYSAVWTGDNRSHWEHLEMSIPMILNLGMSGVAFTGADVGGFASDTTPELLIRWTQVGAFLPYFRNHSVQDSIRQEPWAFGEDTMNSVKKYIELRYKFLPYFYTLFYEAEKTGLPVVRPLAMEYPRDTKTFNCSDQFLVGKDVLIAPILRPGQTHRSVYLPEGVWYNFWTEERYIGGKHFLIEADKDTLPIFVKEGTILPLGTSIQNSKEKQDIELYVYHSKEFKMQGTLYEDDGLSYGYKSDDFSFLTFSVSDTGDVKVKEEGNYTSNSLVKDVRMIGFDLEQEGSK